MYLIWTTHSETGDSKVNIRILWTGIENPNEILVNNTRVWNERLKPNANNEFIWFEKLNTTKTKEID